MWLLLACQAPDEKAPVDTDTGRVDTADTDTDPDTDLETDTDTGAPLALLRLAPGDGAAWVALDAVVTATFDAPVGEVVARLTDGAGELPVTVVVDGPTVTVTPDARFAPGTAHEVTLTVDGAACSASFTTVPTLAPVLAAHPWDPRLDLDGDGAPDAVWSTGTGADGVVWVSLADLAPDGTRTERWSTRLPSGTLGLAPTFHWRSFMGDATRDYTLVVHDGADLWLLAGDGATGELRDWRYDLGDNSFGGVERARAVATVDYQLAAWPGASLLIDSAGSTHGRLFAFPAGRTDGVEISDDPAVVDPAAPWAATPFPGVDLAGDAYTDLYDAFNPDAPCEWITEVSHYRCGVPDDSGVGGYSLDKLAVADIDADGVEDAMSTFLWRSVVWPGRPHGDVTLLGAPDYDEYYNPQEDGGYCHSGRRYGYAVTTQVDDDPPLETFEIAGLSVGTFADLYQEVSYNVALVDATDTGGRVSRGVAWNHALGTMTPGCGQDALYDGVVHVPGEGRLVDGAGVTTHVLANQFAVDGIPAVCEVSDYTCYMDQLKRMTGSWRFRVFDARTGDVAFESEDAYVWDTLVDAATGEVWVVFSAAVDTFNIGAASWDFGSDGGVRAPLPDLVPLLRDDLAVGRIDLASGAIVDVTPVGADRAPVLLAHHLQAWGGEFASNVSPRRVLTVADPAGGAPAFAVHHGEGVTLVARVGTRWEDVATYSAVGDPAGTWSVVVEDAFDDGDITTNVTGVGAGFSDESYGEEEATEADGGLLLHDPLYIYAGVRSVDRFAPTGVEIRVEIAALDTDVVTTDGAPGDVATRTVVGLVDDAAGVFYGLGGTGIYLDLATAPGTPRTATLALRGADFAVLLDPVAFEKWDATTPLVLTLRTDADGWHLRASESFHDGTMGRSDTWYGTTAVEFPNLASVGLVLGHQFESTIQIEGVRVSAFGE